MTWVKICATTNLDDARLSVAAGADALGFIFAPSPRQITAQAAAQIISGLPAEIAKIGVVVNQPPETLAALAKEAGLTGLQLQGEEPAERLTDYRSVLESRTIIKTLQARSILAGGDAYIDGYLHASKFFDAILIDAGSAAQRGGTGVPFDWNALLPHISRIKETMPVIIAGGLSPDNVGDAIHVFQPWGVDVVSGVESGAGRKHEAKLRAFVQAVRRADAATSLEQVAAST